MSQFHFFYIDSALKILNKPKKIEAVAFFYMRRSISSTEFGQ